MVKIIKVFNPEKKMNEDSLLKKVKEVSERIGEYTNSSTFITVQDALSSGSEIFLIEDDKSDKDLEVQRDFINV